MGYQNDPGARDPARGAAYSFIEPGTDYPVLSPREGLSRFALLGLRVPRWLLLSQFAHVERPARAG